jgi:hypothetical protein
MAAWRSVGLGVDGSVTSLLPLTGRTLLAGGEFVTAGRTHALHAARWDGQEWSLYGRGQIRTIALHPNGDLIAAA